MQIEDYESKITELNGQIDELTPFLATFEEIPEKKRNKLI